MFGLAKPTLSFLEVELAVYPHPFIDLLERLVLACLDFEIPRGFAVLVSVASTA
jgi:hypothetical protein